MLEFLMFFAGIVYANFIEFAVHKYLFHGLGKKRNSIFAFHLREHHINVKKNNFADKRFSTRELIGIPVLLLTHLPLYYIAPSAYAALVLYGALFIIMHNLQHSYPEFSKKYFWWHWNHHMRNQNKSWAVVIPIFDIFFGTLEKKP
jgi:hypothetical protein